ncbi:MAG: hypothetical protein U0R70_11665 [Solirubrobacteraceae bacterium]
MPAAVTLPQPDATRLRRSRAAPLGLRLRVAAGRGGLDRAIAAGWCPDTPAFALRARQLRSARCRAQIAAGIERAIARASEAPAWGPSAARAPQRDEIRRAEPRLQELAAALRATGPASPRGVAQASELIADGGSPLYATHRPGALAGRAAAIMLSLHPRA